MSDTTPRLALPYLFPGQAQKEATHNEALAIVDALLQLAVTAIRADPPATAEPGAAWIVAREPTGAWAGHADAIAWSTEGGWRFAGATEGMAAWLTASGEPARFTAGGWAIGVIAARRLSIGGVQVVGARQPAIAAPAGGATVDAEARNTLEVILVALRTHGLITS